MTSHAHAGIGPRIKACIAAAVLAAGLATPMAACAQSVEPVGTSTAVSEAPSATTSTPVRSASAQDAGDVPVSTSAGQSTLSRTKTLTAVIVAVLLAIAASVIVFLRSGRDNTGR